MMDNNKINISELFLAFDGNDKYYYGEIIRNNNNIFGKIYINDHIIFSKVENNKIDKNNKCFKQKLDNFLLNKLSEYVDDSVFLIKNHNILNINKRYIDYYNSEIVLN